MGRVRSLRFSINLPALLAAACFWVYAYYAALSDVAMDYERWTSLGFALLFAFFLDQGARPGCARYDFDLDLDDLLFGGSVLALLAAIGWRELSDSIVNDQLYHGQMALAHPLRLIAEDFIPSGSVGGRLLAGMPARHLVHLVNLGLLGLGITVFFLLLTTSGVWLRLGGAVAFFMLTRWWVAEMVLRCDLHPPLRLAAISGSSALLGVNDVAMRLPGLVALCAVGMMAYRRCKDNLGHALAALWILALVTAPLLWHVATVAESSIWSVTCFIGLQAMYRHQAVQNLVRSHHFYACYTLVALASLMRQSAFIAVIPLGLWHICLLYRQGGARMVLKGGWRDLLPLLVMLPWTIHIAMTGTPASDRSGSPLWAKLDQALVSGDAWRWIYYHLGLLWSLLAGAGVLYAAFRKLWQPTLLLLLSLLLFYSVVPTLWGGARYQAEIGMPLAAMFWLSLAGEPRLVAWLRGFRPVSAVAAVLALGVLAHNVYVYKHIHMVTGIVDNRTHFPRMRDGSLRMLIEPSYALGSALRMARQQGHAEGLYVDGTVYGVLGEIIASYSLKELRGRSRFQPVWEGIDAQLLQRVTAVTAAMFLDWGEAKTQANIAYLLAHGWTIKERIPHYGVKDNIIYLLERPR